MRRGGLHFVADADIVLASSNATFVDTHVSVGQVAALEPIGLVGRLPFSAIMRMALVGRYERLSAARAYELGMVDQVVDPPEELDDVAQALAETIAKNSPSALMATKRAIWAAMETGRTADPGQGHGVREGLLGPPRQRRGAQGLLGEAGPRLGPAHPDVLTRRCPRPSGSRSTPASPWPSTPGSAATAPWAGHWWSWRPASGPGTPW